VNLQIIGYKRPVQIRAKETEAKFITSLEELLSVKAFSSISVDDIAQHAGLTHSAFIRRFGTKKQALYVLYDQYCERAIDHLHEVKGTLHRFRSASEACCYLSSQMETVQRNNLAINRGMFEDFLQEFRIHDRTKKLFCQCVQVMQEIQTRFIPDAIQSDTGAFAAAQLLVTLNCNYIIQSMPGLPRDFDKRHKLIGYLVVEALKLGD
jgi:AcrR family transcriptional regulator